MGIQLPLKGAQHPHFSAHVYCGQTAGWNKMPLGTGVEIVPGHIWVCCSSPNLALVGKSGSVQESSKYQNLPKIVFWPPEVDKVNTLG